MENSMRLGLMAVFAVSGSMVLLAHQVHKRILSNFMKKFEFEIGGISYPHGQKNLSGTKKQHQAKKNVRFAKQVMEVTKKKKGGRRNVTKAQRVKGEEGWVMENIGQKGRTKLEDMMAPNRAVLYRAIMKYRNGTPNGRLRFLFC